MTSTIDRFPPLPSALLTDGLLPVMLFAVQQMSISETYTLPPVGSTTMRSAIGSSDDTISLSAQLIGPTRFVAKQSLELLADVSRRGGALSHLPGAGVGGLLLVTTLTVRTDLYVTGLNFGVSAQRRDVIDVSISLTHAPRPGPLDLLLDLGATGVATAMEFL